MTEYRDPDSLTKAFDKLVRETSVRRITFHGLRHTHIAYSENLNVHEDKAEVVELAPDETSLNFLQKVYRSTKQPMSLRMRVAVGYLTGTTSLRA